MVKRGKSNKYKAAAIALALAATSLTACGDSGKSDGGNDQRVRHDMSTVTTTAATTEQVTTEATNEPTTITATEDLTATTTESSTQTTATTTEAATEITTEIVSADNPVGATQYMADIYNSSKFVELVAATQDEYFNVMLANLKRRVSQYVLDEEGITDARSLEAWIAESIADSFDVEITYNVQVTGAAREATVDEAYSELTELASVSDSTTDHIYEYFRGAEKLYLVPIKIEATYYSQNIEMEGCDVVCIYKGNAYSCLGIFSFGPGMMRYLTKCASSDDVAVAMSIKASAEASLANENAFNNVSNALENAGFNGRITGKDKDGNEKQYFVVAYIRDNTVIEMQNGLTEDGAFCTELKNNLGNIHINLLAYGADKFILAVGEDLGDVAVFAGPGNDDGSTFEIIPYADEIYK